jgi:hypothetical protein
MSTAHVGDFEKAERLGCSHLQDSNILAILGAAVSHPAPLSVLVTHARHGALINLTLTTYHTLSLSSLPLKMSIDALSIGEKGILAVPTVKRA